MDLIIICGHYGCGKTNFALNLALSDSTKKTALIDMDIVNPYFRSGDYKKMLNDCNVDVISPVALGTTVDAPFLSPAIKSAFTGIYERVIIDVGGDDAGATSLGVYSDEIKRFDYEMIYIVNMYREQINTPQKALSALKEIEDASHLKATCIVNNSHLCNQTDIDVVTRSFKYAEGVSKISGLPLKFHCINETFCNNPEFTNNINYFPVKRMVLPPWE